MGRQTAKRRGWEKRLDFSLRFAAPAPEKAKKKVPEDDGGGEEKASKEEKEKVCREGGGRGKTVFPRSVSISLIHLFFPSVFIFLRRRRNGRTTTATRVRDFTPFFAVALTSSSIVRNFFLMYASGTAFGFFPPDRVCVREIRETKNHTKKVFFFLE